jgi:nitroimidazol reductase NimA-like FMN-containing flavoprotein (pyridoxamine 5'-phosphate oxidase superfamily)
MVREYTAPTDMRRKDRGIDDDAWIRALLERAPMGTLATVRDGQPFINTNTFVYDAEQHAIFMHTARTGRTPENVAEDERICFTVTEMGRMLPAPRAFNMSIEYNSVVVFGRARIISDPAEKDVVLRALVDKYFHHLRIGEDYEPADDGELALTAVYRIEIDAWTGKQKRVEDDYPGAFTYRPPAARDG